MNIPIFKGDGCIAYEERDVPRIDSTDNVLVKIHACGICGTDMNILATPPMHKAEKGIIIGHEGVGVVHETYAPLDALALGDRVVIAPRIVCGSCKYCRMGVSNQCINYRTVGTTRDGAFAPFVSLPASALYKISHAVAIDDAVFFEPLSCVVGAVSRVPFEAGSSVVVVGAGPMGALFALLYKAMGAGEVSMVDISQARLEFCKERIGVKTLNAKSVDKAQWEKAVQALEADVAVDAVGNQMPVCIQALRRGGHAILFGLKPSHKSAVEQYAITRNDITVHGTFVGLHPFVKTIAILERAVVRPSRLITHRFSLENLMEGIGVMRNAEGMKVIVDIDGSCPAHE